jgi:hypothetical protein
MVRYGFEGEVGLLGGGGWREAGLNMIFRIREMDRIIANFLQDDTYFKTRHEKAFVLPLLCIILVPGRAIQTGRIKFPFFCGNDPATASLRKKLKYPSLKTLLYDLIIPQITTMAVVRYPFI